MVHPTLNLPVSGISNRLRDMWFLALVVGQFIGCAGEVPKPAATPPASVIRGSTPSADSDSVPSSPIDDSADSRTEAKSKLDQIASDGLRMARSGFETKSHEWDVKDVRVDIRETGQLEKKFAGGVSIHTEKNGRIDCFRIYYVFKDGRWSPTWANRGNLKFYAHEWKWADADASNSQPGFTLNDAKTNPLLKCFLE